MLLRHSERIFRSKQRTAIHLRKEDKMLWVSYGRHTQEGIKGMISNPHNREEELARFNEALGGKLVSFLFLLNGDIDFIMVSEIPESKTSEILLIPPMIIRGSGAIESITIVPAMNARDAVPQMQKAQKMSAAMAYKPPAQS
jgi:uncharacterized protein with GYD domain